MAKTDYKSVDVAAQPEPASAVLQRVRDIVKRAVPGAEELISYQSPPTGTGAAIFSISRDGRRIIRFIPRPKPSSPLSRTTSRPILPTRTPFASSTLIPSPRD